MQSSLLLSYRKASLGSEQLDVPYGVLQQEKAAPADGSPPGSPVPGILQVRSLEWVATPAACSFPGENARSWEALGEARPGQSSLSAGALRYRAWAQSWSSATINSS